MDSQKSLPTSSLAYALAWKKYLQSGEINCEVIKPPIAESWKRCHEASVNPLGGECQHILESRELSRAKEEQYELFHTAMPIIHYHYQFIKGTGVVFVLTDKMGYILAILGDNPVIQDAQKIHFMDGARWTENEVGTNAIGTSLQLQQPINVTAVEHYCQKHHQWTCSAAPIFNPQGTLMGIIDLSGPSRTFHEQALGLAAAIASAVTIQLILERKARELQLIDKRFALVFNHTSDGMIEVDAHGMIKRANSVASVLMQRAETDMIGKPFEEIWKSEDLPIMTALRSNCLNYECSLPYQGIRRAYFLCGEPFSDATGHITGGIVMFKQIDKTPQIVKSKTLGGYGNASYSFADIIGNHPGILEAKHIAQLAAKGLSSVLLQGECGTGKEIFAQAIHQASPRRNGPFVAVNCGAIPKELISSELFGYDEGAFTGAKRGGKPGKFEIASGGTLFFDEIGDMPFEQQIALLRALQENKITRVGGNKEIPVDVRVICATNKHLLREVMHGRFRDDLYYRLNVITIQIPPLRERREDAMLLFTHFLRRYERLQGKEFTVEPDVFEYIQHYSWPGNIRELKSFVERLVSLSEDQTLRVINFPQEDEISEELSAPEPLESAVYVSPSADRNTRKHELARSEKQRITLTLDRQHGNVSRAAHELGMSRNTLYRKMRLYGIKN